MWLDLFAFPLFSVFDGLMFEMELRRTLSQHGRHWLYRVILFQTHTRATLYVCGLHSKHSYRFYAKIHCRNISQKYHSIVRNIPALNDRICIEFPSKIYRLSNYLLCDLVPNWKLLSKGYFLNKTSGMKWWTDTKMRKCSVEIGSIKAVSSPNHQLRPCHSNRHTEHWEGIRMYSWFTITWLMMENNLVCHTTFNRYFPFPLRT